MVVKLTKFERAVLSALKKVPWGQVTTYGELAGAVGRPKAMRAVGNAMNNNPYAPQVPCHRVVRSGGGLGGYAKGVNKKKELLKKEGVEVRNEKIIGFKDIVFRFK